MSQIRLIKKKEITEQEIILPSSKSISNRVLIIRALSKPGFTIQSLSEADDTAMLADLLAHPSPSMNSGDGGTTFRFLLTYLCTLQTPHILTGSEAFCKRPVHTLVEALRTLGADIQYIDLPDRPPLRISPSNMHGGELMIDASLSSQFISALMLIAPTLKGGLKIHLTTPSVSMPYLNMTAQLMRTFGINVELTEKYIVIQEGAYQSKDFWVEPDWSAAGFWFAWIACAQPGASLFLKNLRLSGLQGDEQAIRFFLLLGVQAEVKEDGMLITKTIIPVSSYLEVDFLSCPDLAQPFIAALCCLKIKAHCTGLQTLIHKETNRLLALQSELSKTGAMIEITNSTLQIKDYTNPLDSLVFDTYHDHRMAMCMALFVQRFEHIVISQPDVVKKSYPSFWYQLSKFVEMQRFSD
ncbi:MAG: hypothetical protein LC101_04925 [Flavobacteriales bacterium]|nr:hypothetical protein [Flavobacteriales bacterium]